MLNILQLFSVSFVSIFNGFDFDFVTVINVIVVVEHFEFVSISTESSHQQMAQSRFLYNNNRKYLVTIDLVSNKTPTFRIESYYLCANTRAIEFVVD